MHTQNDCLLQLFLQFCPHVGGNTLTKRHHTFLNIGLLHKCIRQSYLFLANLETSLWHLFALSTESLCDNLVSKTNAEKPYLPVLVHNLFDKVHKVDDPGVLVIEDWSWWARNNNSFKFFQLRIWRILEIINIIKTPTLLRRLICPTTTHEVTSCHSLIDVVSILARVRLQHSDVGIEW